MHSSLARKAASRLSPVGELTPVGLPLLSNLTGSEIRLHLSALRLLVSLLLTVLCIHLQTC